MSLSVFRPNVQKLVRDGSGALVQADYDFLITEAVKRYSRVRPLMVAKDINGDGSYEYSLPVEWKNDWSQLKEVEFPAGQRNPELVDRLDYHIYMAPAGRKLRFLAATPAAGQVIRLRFTAPHTVTENATSVPDTDFDVINALGAALCCESLASHYSNLGDSTIGADSVDHKSKAADYAARAKRFMTLAKELCPQLVENDQVPAAGGETSWGDDESFLTHPTR